MNGRTLVVVALAVFVSTGVAGADPLPVTPFTQDPMGSISDVTVHAEHYQPARTFCIRPDTYELAPDGYGPTTTGADPACANSGFPANFTGLVKVDVDTPPLCAGCRRLFIDFSKIPAQNAAPNFYAHGHAYFHLMSFNPGYAVEPHAHSPNFKNFTNDKLFVPDGSPHEPVVSAFDTRAIAYASDTAHTVYSVAQGPYYAGPWYVNTDGQRINGLYLDVQPSTIGALPDATLNQIGYGAGFYSGEATCPNSLNGSTADGDGWYGGCVDHFGASSTLVDPNTRATPPQPYDAAGFSLTISAPETFVPGVPIAVSGRLLAFAHLPVAFEASQPVSGRDVDVYVDGVATTTTQTDADGAYAVSLTFAPGATQHTIRAAAFEGLPLEATSPTVTTRLEEDNGR